MLWELFSIKIDKLKVGDEFYLKKTKKRRHIVEGEKGTFIQAREGKSYRLINFDQDITVYCEFKYLPKKQKRRLAKEIFCSALFLIFLVITLLVLNN